MIFGKRRVNPYWGISHAELKEVSAKTASYYEDHLKADIAKATAEGVAAAKAARERFGNHFAER